MKRYIVFFCLSLFITLATAQEDKRWGVNVQFGGGTLRHNDDKCWEISEDEVNAFDVSVDYYMNKHLALNAGIYAEQQGLFKEFSDNIGLVKHWVGGIHAGAKYYPLNPKYILQPYLGANIYTNVLNLPKQTGSKLTQATESVRGNVLVDYDIQHSVASVSPQIGLDLRFICSLSLTLSYDYRWELYGHSNGTLRYTSGENAGKIYEQLNNNSRGVLSVGLKLDLPVKKPTEKGVNNLLFFLFDCLRR